MVVVFCRFVDILFLELCTTSLIPPFVFCVFVCFSEFCDSLCVFSTVAAGNSGNLLRREGIQDAVGVWRTGYSGLGGAARGNLARGSHWNLEE